MAPQRKRKAILMFIILELLRKKETPKKRRVRAWMKKRGEMGLFNVIQELSLQDTQGFKEMMRMRPQQFKDILNVIEHKITKNDTNVIGCAPISPAERLALTIRFLATGESYRSLLEVCKAITEVLGPTHLKVPSRQEEWKEIAQQFEQRWNFPNCIGAIDGKHTVIQNPPNAGSHYFNYKRTFSLILLVIAGPDYEVLYADVGTNGRVSDAAVWNKCSFMQAIERKSLDLPDDKPLPYGIDAMPHVIVGDDAFALKPFVMKPYPQKELTIDRRVFNYRLSRARRISENVFGIIANRWRVFRNALLLPPETIEHLLMASLVLHNYLRKSASRNVYCPPELFDKEDETTEIVYPGQWQNDGPSSAWLPLEITQAGNNQSNKSKTVRQTFFKYFNNEGQVSWQWNVCL